MVISSYTGNFHFDSFLPWKWAIISPFTAPACNISGLKDARTRLQTVYFPVLNTSTFNAVRFDENPFKCQYEKENKKAEGFHISHFYWSFSSENMAVKGLWLFQAQFLTQLRNFVLSSDTQFVRFCFGSLHFGFYG